MAQTQVFLVAPDTLELLEAVEEGHPRLSYLLAGRFEGTSPPVFSRAAEIPNLGMANVGSGIGCASFIVFERGTSVKPRPLQDTGVTLYDQLLNPDTVVFTPAGLWRSELVLRGRVSTASDTAAAQLLMKRFRGALQKHCTNINGSYVGRAALRLFEAGTRLAGSPPCAWSGAREGAARGSPVGRERSRIWGRPHASSTRRTNREGVRVGASPDTQLRVAAELDSQGNVVSTFVYGTQPNVPDAMVRGGKTYRRRRRIADRTSLGARRARPKSVPSQQSPQA